MMALREAMIAQVDAGRLGEWLAYLFASLGALWLILQIVNSMRRRPPIDAEFATKHELREAWQEAKAERDVIATRLENVRVEIKSDIGGVHKRVDQVLEAVSRVSGQISRMNGGRRKGDFEG